MLFSTGGVLSSYRVERALECSIQKLESLPVKCQNQLVQRPRRGKEAITFSSSRTHEPHCEDPILIAPNMDTDICRPLLPSRRYSNFVLPIEAFTAVELLPW